MLVYETRKLARKRVTSIFEEVTQIIHKVKREDISIEKEV